MNNPNLKKPNCKTNEEIDWQALTSKILKRNVQRPHYVMDIIC